MVSFSSVPNFAQRFLSTRRRIEKLDIPISSYLKIWVNHSTLNISELGDKKIIFHTDIKRERNVKNILVNMIEKRSVESNVKVVAAEILGEKWLKPIISDLWLNEDVVPFFKPSNHSIDPSTIHKESVWDIVGRFREDQIANIVLTKKNEVEVAELVTLEDYRNITPLPAYELLRTLAKNLAGKKIVFINATPQGGGVAIMRHALIRLYNLLGVDAHWHVLYPRKEAFDVTKTKFHNVLQNVADPETRLNDSDRETYSSWIKQNAQRLEKVYIDADVVIVDDPQPTGLIPYIKKVNPKVKILYRSHIQLESHLIDTPGTPQNETWSFIWENAKDADLFISHPIEAFIPSVVPFERTVTMPATTDALDGLNKRLKSRHSDYYLKLFDQMLIETQQSPLDKTRPYVIQVARFDPSKGIPDVIESYRILVEKLKKNGKTIPQLVIVGHGSIDDPDGIPIYTLTMELLRSESYKDIASDVKVMRVPSVDQILNALVRESHAVLQLSHKEGFEVKVSEALMKGKPVVAYKAGGIPLQIIDGVSGFLIPVGKTEQVADKLYQLFTNLDLYHEMSRQAKENVNPETTTIANATKWLFLADELLKNGKIVGNRSAVRDLIRKKYKV